MLTNITVPVGRSKLMSPVAIGTKLIASWHIVNDTNSIPSSKVVVTIMYTNA